MLEEEKTVCEEVHFKTLFKTHSRVLRNYIYYKSGDNLITDDIIQESFIKLWDNCASVPFKNALFFLKRVSKNLLLNEIKHKKVVLTYKTNISKEELYTETPHFILEEKEFADKVKKVIENLPEKEREVFLLSRIDKMKYKEIAEFLDISIKTVEKRMTNALVDVRKHLGKV